MIELIAISLLTVLAAAVGTLTGFGTSTIMVPVLLFFFPIGETLLLVGIIHWFGNVWKVILFRSGIRWRLVLTFGVPGAVLSYIGARLTFQVPDAILSQAVGAALIGYVVFLAWKPALKVPQTDFTAILGGAFSGFIAGISGIGGVIRGASLSVFNLPKAVYLFTGGVIGLLIDGVRVATYAAGGTQLSTIFLWGLLLFIPASFIGAKLGKRMVKRVSDTQFRWIIALLLCIVGTKLLVFP